jgi:hypothetical protein
MPGFDDQSIRRISRTVQQHERRLRGRRQKRGRWHGKGSGGGSGAPFITFDVVSSGPLYDDTSVECNTVTATVLSISCQATGVAVGNEVVVWDTQGCWFSIPIENLENARGTAIRMSRGTGSVISECSEDDPTEACYWMVVNLCCLEEVSGS